MLRILANVLSKSLVTGCICLSVLAINLTIMMIPRQYSIHTLTVSFTVIDPYVCFTLLLGIFLINYLIDSS